MKKRLFISLIPFLLLSGCIPFNRSSKSDKESETSATSESVSATSSFTTTTSEETSSSSEEGSESTSSTESTSENEEPATISSIQDMNILHAWNWKLNDIKSRLASIKAAGYGAVQISPMQPKVDKNSYSNENTWSQWWKLYQPLAFKIAENDESFLGTKSDLTALCAEAKKQNIKIVVDVVSNHLAGSDNNYNSQVYTKYPLHSYGATNDNSVQAVVQGHIGLPDLDTSTTQVQQDVLSMLKSYIDCGVSGFRFDAAKHIETPDDGAYASEYWPTVLNGTTTYAKSKGLDEPYYYGEILYTCGTGRSFSSYTKMMSVVDNKQGTATVEAVKNSKLDNIKDTYNTGVNPDHLVLWAESHDTYANTYNYDITRDYSTEVINKAYMIQASRKDAATLYLARPSNMDAMITSVSDSSGWKNKEVQAINTFHSHYVGKSEKITKESGCFINVRGTGSYAGAAIINVSGSSSVTLNVDGLSNGTYVDLISNKEFVVNNKTVNVTFTNGGCILVPKGSIEVEESEDYNSSVVVKGANSSYSYVAWAWSSTNSGRWVDFTTDKDAIGIVLSAGDSFTIVEFPSGVSSSNAKWEQKIKQTEDMFYSGSQTIYNYSDLPWKNS